MSNEPTLLRLNAVLARTGLGRTTLFKLIAAKRFPAPRRLADARISVWNSTEVADWVASQLNNGD